jgi:phosphoribosylamine--glycine ligase
MKFLLIDPHGDALDVSMRACAAGHDVRHFIRDTPRTCHIGAGLVPVIRDFTPSLDWADLIFMADNVLYLRQLDSFRAFRPNALIVGPTFEAAQWELDRRVGFKVFEDHGIDVAPYREFDSYDAAISFVKKEDRRFVSKPFGDADKQMTYASGGPDPTADMVYMLTKWRKKFGHPKDHFILQEFIDGIEISADGWFGPGGFDCGWCEGFEFKKLMPGDFGVNTGEMGSVFRFTRRSKLARKVLEPLSDALADLGYVGYISVNTIIDASGNPWPLEFTLRPGYPSINIEAEVHTIDDPVERLYSLAKGEDCNSIALDRVALGVVVALPSFPHGHALSKEIDGIPIHGITDRLMPHLHPCQIRRGNNGTELETAGDYVMVLTAQADTVSGARHTAYDRVKKIWIPGGVSVRIDIGERLSKELPELQAHGYALGLEY